MKEFLIFSLAFPMFLAASPIACPTTTYGNLLTLPSCTSEYSVAPHDAVYVPNSYVYVGLNLTGDPGAGRSVVTDIGLTATTTDGSNAIRAVSLGEDATVSQGGPVTFTDSGQTGAGAPFSAQVSDSIPLAQALLHPTNSVQSNAALSALGPDAVNYFTIDLVNLTAVPEPATSFLIGFGLLGITYAGRKLRKRA